MPTYPILRVLSMIGGLALVSVVAYLNAHEAHLTTGSWTSPTVIAIIALAFGSALAVPVAQAMAANKQVVLTALAVLGIMAGESFGFVTSAERLLKVRNDRVAAVQKDNQEAKLAKDEKDNADKALKAADDKANEERGKGGCKKICLDWEAKAKEARERVAKAEARLKAAPVVRSESLIADVTGWSATAVEIIPALAFPTALLILGFVLVAFGHDPRGHEPAEATQTAPAVEAPATLTTALVPLANDQESKEAIAWVREFRAKHGRDPQIPELQAAHPLPKTTAWRRIKEA